MYLKKTDKDSDFITINMGDGVFLGNNEPDFLEITIHKSDIDCIYYINENELEVSLKNSIKGKTFFRFVDRDYNGAMGEFYEGLMKFLNNNEFIMIPCGTTIDAF